MLRLEVIAAHAETVTTNTEAATAHTVPVVAHIWASIAYKAPVRSPIGPAQCAQRMWQLMQGFQ